jgi:hypothetical protein
MMTPRRGRDERIGASAAARLDRYALRTERAGIRGDVFHDQAAVVGQHPTSQGAIGRKEHPKPRAEGPAPGHHLEEAALLHDDLERGAFSDEQVHRRPSDLIEELFQRLGLQHAAAQLAHEGEQCLRAAESTAALSDARRWRPSSAPRKNAMVPATIANAAKTAPSVEAL